ncbi:hypothetical protein ACLK19_06105 [Escherichia coli]
MYGVARERYFVALHVSRMENASKTALWYL